MNVRYRLKFGRIVAGARAWESDLDLYAVYQTAEHELTHRATRDSINAQDYADVTPPAMRRRDNLEIPLSVVVDGSDIRRLQEFTLWAIAFEPITSYFTVYNKNGAIYTDKSTEAMNLSQSLTLIVATDHIYIGADSIFNDIDFLHSVLGVGCNFNVNYWNGAWVNVAALVDNTIAFTVDSNMTFTMPTDWAKTTEGGNLPNKYWIELDFTAAATKPIWRYIRPTVPIMLLLQKSVDHGSTWQWYHDGAYYPNLWDVPLLRVHFQTGGLADRVTMRLLEGY